MTKYKSRASAYHHHYIQRNWMPGTNAWLKATMKRAKQAKKRKEWAEKNASET